MERRLRIEDRPDILIYVDIKSVQECMDDGYMTIVQVHSASEPGKSYQVVVQSPLDTSDAICECEGYKFRGHCRHQEAALRNLCRWTEVDGPEVQTKQQRRDKICPRCFGTTEWSMEVT